MKDSNKLWVKNKNKSSHCTAWKEENYISAAAIFNWISMQQYVISLNKAINVGDMKITACTITFHSLSPSQTFMSQCTSTRRI
jgi:hypothetical protein